MRKEEKKTIEVILHKCELSFAKEESASFLYVEFLTLFLSQSPQNTKYP
jgi:hypothetical protein